MDGPVYRFGAFELDAKRRRLNKDGQLWPLPDRQFDLLLALCAARGQLVSKQELADSSWHGVAVSDNSIDRAISSLRQVLGTQPDGSPAIELRKRLGVRLAMPVTRLKHARRAASIAAVLEPLSAFVDGRIAIDTFDKEAVDRAHQAFAEAVKLDPDGASGHIGLANALLLKFEATRADPRPDRAALERADHHASEACRLDEASAEAWSTLACVRHERGESIDAIAAARRAVLLAPHGWHHHLRLAYVTWGSDRLDAAVEALSLCPTAPLGHRFAATVLVARQAFDRAAEYLRAGCAAQDAQATGAGRFSAVGLHLLNGLVAAAQGDVVTARAEFARELAMDNPDHVFARECGANTWCGIGALALREGRRDEARRGFQEALARVPGHAMATVGLTFLENRTVDLAELPCLPSRVDTTIVHAAALALQERHAEASAMCHAVLLKAEPGTAGYLLPVEPLVAAMHHRDAWQDALATVSARAS